MESIYFYWSFQGGTFVVVFIVICLGVKFLYYLNLMYVFHIFSQVWVTEWPPVG